MKLHIKRVCRPMMAELRSVFNEICDSLELNGKRVYEFLSNERAIECMWATCPYIIGLHCIAVVTYYYSTNIKVCGATPCDSCKRPYMFIVFTGERHQSHLCGVHVTRVLKSNNRYVERCVDLKRNIEFQKEEQCDVYTALKIFRTLG